MGPDPVPDMSAVAQPSESAATATSRPDSAAMNACVVLVFVALSWMVKRTLAAIMLAITKPTRITSS